VAALVLLYMLAKAQSSACSLPAGLALSL